MWLSKTISDLIHFQVQGQNSTQRYAAEERESNLGTQQDWQDVTFSSPIHLYHSNSSQFRPSSLSSEVPVTSRASLHSNSCPAAFIECSWFLCAPFSNLYQPTINLPSLNQKKQMRILQEPSFSSLPLPLAIQSYCKDMPLFDPLLL